MSNKKLTCLAVATMLGAALITAPVQARGAVHGGAVGRLGGGGFREAATGPGLAGRTGFVGSPNPCFAASYETVADEHAKCSRMTDAVEKVVL
jgi:uncharacterized protein YcfJ